jgi:hypothetical protein
MIMLWSHTELNVNGGLGQIQLGGVASQCHSHHLFADGYLSQKSS